MLLVVAAVVGAAAVASVRQWAREVDRHPATGAVVVAAGALLGALAFDAAPTGMPAADAVLRAALVGLCAAAGTTAHRIMLVVSSALAVGVLVGASSPLDWAAAAALGGAAVLAVTLARPHGARGTGGLVGAALGAFVLTIEWGTTFAPSLAAAAVVLPLWVSGSFYARTRTRRGLLWAGVAVAVAALAATVGSVVAVVQARSALTSAVDEARSGLDVLGVNADRDAAMASVASAEAAFAEGRARLEPWWARGGLAVPVVGQHLRAATDLAAAGEDLTRAASSVLAALDPATLRPVGGRVDLNAMAALDGSLQQADTAMGTGIERLDALRSPWLVPLLTERRDEFTDDLGEARSRAAGVRDGIALARQLLGEDGSRRYLLVVQTLSEARATGGWWGNWGFLDVDGGRIDLVQVGRMLELTPPAPFDLSDVEPGFVERYGYIGLTSSLGRMNVVPDLPTVGRAVTTVFPQTGRGEVDGIIAIDPVGLAAMLRVTGPITVSGWPEPITSENAARVLLFDTYDRLAGGERVDVIGEVASTAWRALLAVDGADLRTLVEALRPTVKGKHLQVFSTDPAEQAELERLGIAGALAPVQGDTLAVVTQNLSASKVDWFLERSTSYDVVVDPATGAVEAELVVRLRNTAPRSGVSDEVIGFGDRTRPELTGTNRTWISVYSPLALRSATLDGTPVEVGSAAEFGRWNHTAVVVVPPEGGVSEVRLRLAGTFAPGEGYRLDVTRQPLPRTDPLAVTVRAAEGWRVRAASLPVAGGQAAGPVAGEGDVTVRAVLAPDRP